MTALALLLVGCAPVTVDGPAGDTAPPPSVGVVDDDLGADPDAPLAVCLNELMPSNQAALFTEDGETPDWIELHNPGSAAVDLTGWALTDAPDAALDAAPRLDLSMPAGGFVVLYADGGSGAEHLPFRLEADGGALGLFAPDGRGQVVRWGRVEGDYAVARSADCCDGADCLDFQFRGTPGASNAVDR